VLYVEQIPMPNEGLLKEVNNIVQLVTPQTIGLTLRYGIFIRLDYQGNRRLLIHEFVHTSQYERFGGTRAFLQKIFR